jgi:hypothetical protein
MVPPQEIFKNVYRSDDLAARPRALRSIASEGSAAWAGKPRRSKKAATQQYQSGDVPQHSWARKQPCYAA